MPRKFKTFAIKEINEENHFSPELNLYESSVAQNVVSLVVKSGPGLRLNKEQVVEVNDWLTEWLAER